mmetsp:Transcript_59094/g.128470  ORF Transcript_59094/g.128470 Transcript_59094/m.128470 type:complete len:300 (-) Transcript_59094:672-1571(-)
MCLLAQQLGHRVNSVPIVDETEDAPVDEFTALEELVSIHVPRTLARDDGATAAGGEFGGLEDAGGDGHEARVVHGEAELSADVAVEVELSHVLLEHPPLLRRALFRLEDAGGGLHGVHLADPLSVDDHEQLHGKKLESGLATGVRLAAGTFDEHVVRVPKTSLVRGLDVFLHRYFPVAFGERHAGSAHIAEGFDFDGSSVRAVYRRDLETNDFASHVVEGSRFPRVDSQFPHKVGQVHRFCEDVRGEVEVERHSAWAWVQGLVMASPCLKARTTGHTVIHIITESRVHQGSPHGHTSGE